jgi:hypothetical protein
MADVCWPTNPDLLRPSAVRHYSDFDWLWLQRTTFFLNLAIAYCPGCVPGCVLVRVAEVNSSFIRRRTVSRPAGDPALSLFRPHDI